MNTTTKTARPVSSWTTEELIAYATARQNERRTYSPQALRDMGHTGPATWGCGEDCGRKGCCA